MGAEPPIQGGDIVEIIALHGQAAQQQQAAPVDQGMAEGGDVVGDGREIEIFAAEAFGLQATGSDPFKRRIEGGEVGRLQIESELILAREIASLPDRRMVDDAPLHGLPSCWLPAKTKDQ